MTEELPGTLADLAATAERLLDPGPHGYYVGGAGDEITLRENVAAWGRLRLRQRVLVDVSERDASVRLLGRERPTPFVVAPMAFQRTLHPGGEPELARGAAAAGAIYCLSTLATCGLAELAAGAPDAPRWLQLYVFRDRALSRAMLAEAEATGFEAVVVTADLPVLGRRDRDVRSGFALPVVATMPSAAAGARGELTPREFADLIDPSLTWDDLADVVARSSLPVLVKGVLEPDDARRAVDAGVAGIVVSNHGGRQLDTVAPTAEALPGVVEAVREAAGDRVDILVDGGIRRGGDAAKALALGATAVGIGRPAAWGLAVGGAAGVERVFDILRTELDLALALTGVRRARDLSRSVLG